MNDELRQRILLIARDVMGVDLAEYEQSRKISSIAEWDSFNNLMLIARFQDEFHVEFSAVEIEATQTIGQLWELIERKTAR
jgi:acyl carrier protein